MIPEVLKKIFNFIGLKMNISNNNVAKKSSTMLVGENLNNQAGRDININNYNETSKKTISQKNINQELQNLLYIKIKNSIETNKIITLLLKKTKKNLK